jgi:hypothetical protein
MKVRTAAVKISLGAVGAIAAASLSACVVPLRRMRIAELGGNWKARENWTGRDISRSRMNESSRGKNHRSARPASGYRGMGELVKTVSAPGFDAEKEYAERTRRARDYAERTERGGEPAHEFFDPQQRKLVPGDTDLEFDIGEHPEEGEVA